MIRLVRICFLDQYWEKGKWKLPLLLTVSLVLYEVAAVKVMTVLSKLYSSVSSQNRDLFWTTLGYSIAVVTVISIFKSMCSFASDSCALRWRSFLVEYMQDSYILRSQSQNTLALSIDGIDQRITQDVDLFTSKCATLLSQVMLLPLVIAFYSVYLAVSFGWITVAICFSYFVVGCIGGSSLARRLVNLTYLQEFYEGLCDFDYHSFTVVLMMHDNNHTCR